MNHRRHVTAALIVAGALAGCGSSGISPAAYRTKVNKLCQANNAAITALPSSDSNSLAGIEKELSIDEHTLTAIKGVSVPSSIGGGVHAWLSLVEKTSGYATEVVAALKRNDEAQLRALSTTGSALNRQSNAKAVALKLTSCAASPTPSGS